MIYAVLAKSVMTTVSMCLKCIKIHVDGAFHFKTCRSALDASFWHSLKSVKKITSLEVKKMHSVKDQHGTS